LLNGVLYINGKKYYKNDAKDPLKSKKGDKLQMKEK
jgi:hypothetical protein